MDKLLELVDNVYFQPPESIKLRYPCCIYKLSRAQMVKADNKVYKYTRAYDLTFIDHDPDVEWDKIVTNKFDYAAFDRRFVSENLNHWSFTLYY